MIWNLYKRTKTMTDFEMNKQYKRGAYLIGRKIVDEDKDKEKQFEIIAWAKMDSGSMKTPRMLLYDFKHNTDWDASDTSLVAMRVFERPRTKWLSSPTIIASKEFFEYALRVYAHEMEIYSYIYDVEPSQVFGITQVDNENHGIAFHGITVEPEKERDEIEEKLRRVVYISLEELRRNKGKGGSAIETEIGEFIETTTYNEFHNSIEENVLGQDALSTVTVGVYAYLRNLKAGRANRANIMICGGSGVGKTHTFRALKEYFAEKIPSLPVYQVDMNMITSEGFKGKNTIEIIRPLIESEKSTGQGIVYIDEFDKRICPSYDSRGANVNAAIQAQLLTLIEGREEEDRGSEIDTSKTLFIFGGSFNEVRTKRKARVAHAGFGAKSEEAVDHFVDISREDIIKLGASYELLGRIPIIANYHPLSEDTIKHIVENVAYSVSEMLGVNVKLSDKKIMELVDSSKSEYGCREFEAKIYEPAFRAFAQAMKENRNIDETTIILNGEDKFELQKNEKISIDGDSEEFIDIDDWEFIEYVSTPA